MTTTHAEPLVSVALARRLREAGVRWAPAPGDRFVIEQLLTPADPDDEPGPGEDAGVGDGAGGAEGTPVFTISDMTIEEHRYETGSVLGFNGTTEWALDSVALEDALWLPAEHQLRALLGPTFRTLAMAATDPDAFEVTALLPGDAEPTARRASTAADAYAVTLLALVDRTR